MRKYIIGILMGLCLSFAVGAHAEVITMIGKVVDGTLNVTVNGNKLDTSAIVIEGVSYLPVRDIGNALGLKVDYDPNSGVTVDTPSTAVQDQINALGTKAKDLFEQRRLLNNASIAPYETPSGKDENGRDVYKVKDDVYYAAKKQYDDITNQMNDILKQIEELTKQK